MSSSFEYKNFNEVIESIYARRPNVMKPGLDRIEATLDMMGNPQDSSPIIEVVGTNGKTSTTLMTARLLHTFGLTAGSFTSPHLQKLNERIRVNGELISDEELVRSYHICLPFVEVVDQTSVGMVSFFEVVTAMAFTYFADVPVDVAVLEAGMGGEWDATNIANAEVVIITPISDDHPQLGSTLVEKAQTKAKVIKGGINVVCGPQEDEVLKVISDHCANVGADLKVYGEDFSISGRDLAVGGQLLDIEGVVGEYEGIFLPMLGRHQAINASMAVAAVEAFSNYEGKLQQELLVEGFASVQNPGRLEIVHEEGKPTVLLDGAHNVEGMKTLVKALNDDISFSKVVLLLGILDDKDIENTVEVIKPVADEVVVVSPNSSRAGDPARLASIFASDNIPVTIAQNAQQALRLASSKVRADSLDAVVVTGSLYLVGEIRELLGKAVA